MNRFYFCLFFLLFLFSCSKKSTIEIRNYTFPDDVDRESLYNSGYVAGRDFGVQRGVKIGESKGFDLGYSKGYRQGSIVGRDSLIREMEEKRNEEDFMLAVSLNYNVFSENVNYIRNQLSDLYISLKDEVDMQSYLSGYQDGYVEGFDSLYNISLNRNQYLNTRGNSIEYSPAINYRDIVTVLHRNYSDDGKVFVRQTDFSRILRNTHEEYLYYLSSRLNLTIEEETLMFSIYSEHHEKISALYYKAFIQRARSTPAFSNLQFSEGLSEYTSIFTTIVITGITGISDICLTHAKSNPLYASNIGFEAMGHIGQSIIEDFLWPLTIKLQQQTVYIHYGKYQNSAQKSIQTKIHEGISFDYLHRDYYSDNIELNSGEVDFEIEITTLIECTIDTSNLLVDINHESKKITIDVSDKIRVLEIKIQDYAITEVRKKFEIAASDRERKLSVRFRKSDFKKYFNANKKEIDEIQESLPNNFQPDLSALKYLVTSITMRELNTRISCYKVDLNVGGKVISLEDYNCQ
jgi:hypothetical protein